MKRLLALLLTPTLLMGFAGCGSTEPVQETEAPTTLPPVTGYVVPQPMTQRPEYILTGEPTVRQMREMAVKAMQDMLSIQWTTDKAIDYNKTGAVSHKNYHYDPDTVYCGLPYADGQTNIYAWLEYYDYRSGQMKIEDGAWLNTYLGNTCAGSLMWAWSTVCDSLTGNYVNYNMVPQYGCLPVGDYKCDKMNVITTWKDYPTKQVCEENGMQKMFECYAQIQMADAVTSTTPEHTMMAIEDAVVVKDANGNIDPLNSYVMVQDQAAGTGDKFYEHTGEDGQLYQYTGRTGPIALKCTFMWLFEKHYIPVTTSEFQGNDPYVRPEVKCTAEQCESVDQLFSANITSNYPMSVLKLYAKDSKGKTTQLHFRYFNRKDVGSGLARSFKLGTDRVDINTALEKLAAGEYTLIVEVTAPNGEIFQLAQAPYKK